MKPLIFRLIRSTVLGACCLSLHGLAAAAEPPPKVRNLIFMLGDGMGLVTMTAARIYAVGEAGQLTVDTLPETAFVKTYSHDGQVTDSAAGMVAYMTGMKVNNEVISMTPDTLLRQPLPDANGNKLRDNCGAGNGKPITTLIELAKRAGRGTGIVTTSRVTDATPAAAVAHTCARHLENDIAQQMVPGGAGYNAALGATGLDVVLGGGRQFFMPFPAGGGKRSDGRDLIAEIRAQGYDYVADGPQLRALGGRSKRLFGLFANYHMEYELERDAAKEPSLTEMALAAMDTLSTQPNGYVLMLEGGRIDHGLHATWTKRALHEMVEFDRMLKAVIAKARERDPELRETLIVLTADHDHTLIMNDTGVRTGPTTAGNPGVLGYARDAAGTPRRDLDGAPYTVLGYGNSENRVMGSRENVMPAEGKTAEAAYHHEGTVRMRVGAETHGGSEVFLGAIGQGAARFHGKIENTRVFDLMKEAAGL
ncbi:MAG TPA: alkaline phosphatase [Burkholderiaceae bacterium]